jgi:tight adherence protein B
MDETTLFYVLIFLATVALTVSISSAFVRPYATNRRINRRVALIQTGTNSAQALDLLRRERWLSGEANAGRFGSLRKLLVQSGVRFDPGQIAAVVGSLGLGVFLLLWWTYGLGVESIIGTIAAVILLPLAYLYRTRKQRIAKFSTQIPDVIDLIVRSLRAGHPLGVAFALAAREMPDPAGTEFGIVSDEIQFGASLPDAMQNMSYRVGDPDLDYLITCIAVQSQTGGNLGEVLSRLAKLMRDRFRLARKVRALTSEARMSGVILSLFPMALFGIINVFSPGYYGEVWHLPSFHTTLMVSAVMLFVGNFVMRRMADIDY